MGLPLVPETCYEDDFIDNIWLACAEGNLPLVKYMLSSGQFTVNQQDSSGQSPLHAAVSYDRKETALYLLQLDADVHIQDKDGDTPLHWAESESMAKLLIEAGALPTALNFQQQSPLQVARYENRRSVYLYLRRMIRQYSNSSRSPFVYLYHRDRVLLDHPNEEDDSVSQGNSSDVILMDSDEEMEDESLDDDDLDEEEEEENDDQSEEDVDEQGERVERERERERVRERNALHSELPNEHDYFQGFDEVDGNDIFEAVEAFRRRFNADFSCSEEDDGEEEGVDDDGHLYIERPIDENGIQHDEDEDEEK